MTHVFTLLYRSNAREGFNDWVPVHIKLCGSAEELEAYQPPEPYWKYRPGGGGADKMDCWHVQRLSA